ncbi:MAG: dTDP-4-amino-4,6-dideoxygalactose transaminase [Ignavibacteriae bacterium]|nr:dTDP-4-amino-4,6-dideoxygalactose transaminase [Ignavibacteriota bacterium]
MIFFNKPYLTGKETQYIFDAVKSGKISGNGDFTQKCNMYFEDRYGFKKCLLTSSCTDALEMCALLLDIKPGDEVIVPSYTFVSTANAFILRGANIIFADSSEINPNIDENKIVELITSKTKAIVVVHYAGIACNMDKIMQIAEKHNLFVIEDAAQAIDSYYSGKPLGSIGHLSAFSFHETKNIISGEGGMLVVNDDRFIKRAEIIWEKGTNRAAFWRGEIDKYGWVDVGSSFLPSEIVAAFLYAQIEEMDKIQTKRQKIWIEYYKGLVALEQKGYFKLPFIPDFATNNGHMFYVVCKNEDERDNLIKYLKENGVYAVFHYQSLHKSPFYENRYKGKELKNCDFYSDCLLRLPFYFELEIDEINTICKLISKFYNAK